SGCRYESRLVDGLESVLADRGLALLPGNRDRLVDGDEPLRRVAKDHRRLGAPRVRIGVLEPPARDQCPGLDQLLDHSLVRVAELALVVDDALRMLTAEQGHVA